MTDSIARRGWDRDRSARRTKRHQPRTHGAALLTSYLDNVTGALAAHGWRVESSSLTSRHGLEAELLLRPCDSRLADGHPVRVRWEEDTGWCVSHHLLGAQSPPLCHYLPTKLVPSPTEAARFIAGALSPTADPYDPDFAWVGMPYPTHFRYRSEPLAPVLEDLERVVVASNRNVPPHPGPRS